MLIPHQGTRASTLSVRKKCTGKLDPGCFLLGFEGPPRQSFGVGGIHLPLPTGCGVNLGKGLLEPLDLGLATELLLQGRGVPVRIGRSGTASRLPLEGLDRPSLPDFGSWS